MALLRIIFKDTIEEIFYFPFWWYSRGLGKTLKAVGASIAGYQNSLGFLIWVKNIFVPMFGQSDWQGRIVSFFMRLANIIIRGFALLIVIIVHFIFIIVYLFLPILVIFLIIQYFSVK